MKMTKRAERVLESSIKHWERLASGTSRNGESIGSDDCALCRPYWAGGCVSCPIMAATGVNLCIRTPYRSALNACTKYGYLSPEFKFAAKRMLTFLKKLRPRK